MTVADTAPRIDGPSTAIDATPIPTAFRSRPTMIDLLCLIYLVAVAFGALLAPVLPQIDPYTADFSAVLQPPTADHWFGTDSTGRSVFDRTVAGARSTLTVAVMTVLIGVVVGGGLGMAGGYLGGMVDTIVGTLIELLLSLPGLILVLVIVTLLGPGYLTIGGVISMFMIAPFARIARSATLAVRDQPYVQASRLLGAGTVRTLVTEVVPTVMPAISAYAFTAVTGAVVAEGSLSFLGFGLQPPAPSWGGLIAEGRTHISTAPWITMAPSLVLCATILAVNLLGQRFSTTRRSS
ncbi:MAG TPA: ABC transporter permease [Candidatus Brachybacterium merdigallinarum]|nr:ABC transporter permease [Candidatus Brachybacterium merdigallinarum]